MSAPPDDLSVDKPRVQEGRAVVVGAKSAGLRVLVLVGHPRGPRSLCGGLAAAYVRGAKAAGAEVELVDLAQLRFERDVTETSPAAQPMEEDLVAVREAIDRAEHLVFVYPTWWGTHPALLKAFLDRILVPGWAFREIAGGTGYEGLLKDKTAECLTTMDTPAAVYRFLYRAPGDNCLRRATLGFCGMDVVRISRFSVVKDSSPAQRDGWLARAEALGRRLDRGVPTSWGRFTRAAKSWIAAVRPQFYPMTFLAYLLGSLGAPVFDQGLFWLGYLAVFLIEVATVFANEAFDYESDRRNAYFGPFNGGSRVLVDRRLTRRQLLSAGGAATAAALALIGGLTAASGDGWPGVLAVYLAALLLGLAYTVPPAKLCHRGFGEVTVAATHSFAAIFAGFLLQQGSAASSWPWLISLPLFLAVLPAITLSAVPDSEADAAAGKRSLAVRFGIGGAFAVAIAGTLAAVLAALAVAAFLPALRLSYLALALIAGAHAAWLLPKLLAARRRTLAAKRIDGLMVASLSFILWFALVPLIGIALGD